MMKTRLWLLLIILPLSTIAAIQSSWRYGNLTIDYPNFLKPSTHVHSAYFLNNTWSLLQLHNPPRSNLIVSFPILDVRKNNYSYYSTIRIGKSKSPLDVKNCFKPALCTTSNCHLRDTVIQGRQYHVFKIQDAGMSHYLMGKSYRFRQGNTCYAMEWVATGFNQSNGKDLTALMNHQKQKLPQLMRQFRFRIQSNY